MKPVTAIIFKDIVIEMRSKESISSMLMFGVLVLTIFSFAFEPSSIDRSLIAPGILWVAFSFAATSITCSTGTKRNSACGSTNFLISHGQATRSTFTFSRVTHFMMHLRD